MWICPHLMFWAAYYGDSTTVLEGQSDYDHLAQWKKSLDDDGSAPVIFAVIFVWI